MTKYVGKPIPRYDGIGHVTGTTTYVDDINMPGMLYAKVLRSPVPKGVIRHIDVSGAENLPGVAAVITAKDIPGKNRYYNDEQPVFVEDHIRYKGERIAAVAAVDEDTAMEALEKIKIEIEEQPPVFDPFEAMKPTAPKVRPQGNLWIFNSGESRVVTKGDVEKGFAESDEIIERTYTEKMNDMAAIEPHVAVAYTDGSDRLLIHTVSQARHFHLGHLCPIFNLPLSKICLIGGTVGGGFGGKNEVQTEHVAGLLALKLRKPVKYRLTRQEVLQCTTKRGAFYFEYKSGVKKNGKVMAYKIRAVHDIGAYNTMGAYAVEKHSFYIVGPYDVPHVRYDGYAVFTNKPVSSSMRGFSTINVNYAHEVQMDLMAEAIGMDPWEIRFINAWREGDTAPNQWKVVAAGLIETMKKAAEMEGVKLPPHLLAMSSQRREKE
jgi:CO/xanthine dehydrogenase Mo-binding subunit